MRSPDKASWRRHDIQRDEVFLAYLGLFLEVGNNFQRKTSPL